MGKRVFLAVFCVFMMFTGCNENVDTTATLQTEPETTAVAVNMDEVVFEKENISLIESDGGFGAVYGMSKDMEVTQYDGVTYAFEPNISLEERKACIEATKTILNRIGTGPNIQINIYTASSYRYTFVKESVVFTHVQDWESIDYACAVLYGLFGEYCNYGMIYGYANYLYNDIYGLPLDVLDAGWSYDGNMDSLDLTLLCFRDEFVDEETIQNAQRIASTFVNQYINEKGAFAFQLLLRDSGNVENVDLFVQALAQFYASNGIDHAPTNILYRMGGKGYDYIVKCPYAVMYLEEDWFDANKDLCPYTYDNFLHENYSDAKQFFTINIRQMEQYQELFALESYNHDLDIFFTNYSGVKYSHYNGYAHAICLYNTASLMHEYIHALTFGSYMLEAWAVEGFARYYSYRYDYYGVAMSTVDYNSAPETTKFQYVHDFKRKIGRDIDMAQDYAELQHITAYVNSFDDPNDGDGYTAGASFIDYLISRLGEERVIEIICKTHNYGEYSYEELVADWNAFLQENYSDYQKIR